MSALFYAGAATAPMVRGAAGHHPCALARTPGVRPRSKEYCINPSRFRSSQASARLLADEPTGNQRVATLQVSMEEGSDSTRLKASLRELLRDRRELAQGDDDNFNILDTQQPAETLSGTTQVLTTLLGANECESAKFRSRSARAGRQTDLGASANGCNWTPAARAAGGTAAPAGDTGPKGARTQPVSS